MSERTFNCTVLTPERTILDAPASFAAIPAHDGEIGILRDRAPLLCRLGIGILRLQTSQGLRRMFIDAGFAEMLDNQLTVLTEQAADPGEVDSAAEQAALESARNQPAVTAEEHEAKRRAIARAATKLKLASK